MSILAKDWNDSKLGPVSTWPEILINTLNIILNTRNPVFMFWGEDNICFYNDGYIPILGFGKHPLVLGQPAKEVWPEIWDKYTYPELKKALDGNATWNIDQYIPVFRNGETSEAYFTYGYSPIYLNDGAIGGVIVIATETTEKIVAQRELKDFLSSQALEAEKKRQALFSVLMHAPVAICVLDGPEHVYSLANEKYYELLGRKRELIGLTIRKALPDVAGQGFYEILDNVFTTGIPFFGKESPVTVDLTDGSKKNFYVNFSYQPKYNSDGIIDGIVAVIVDVTFNVVSKSKIENLAKELSDALKIRDEFLSIASHELRTPLTSLKIQLHMARKGVDPEKNLLPSAVKLDKTLNTINSQVERLTLLIDDLLDVSRIESGKMSYQFADEDVSILLRDVLDKFSDQITTSKYQINLQIEPDVIINCDRFRIEQVIINLLTNSLKYGAGHPVTISITSNEQFAILRFTDQGIGIASEMQDKIFQRFERAASDKNISGLGLGLYITKQIVDAHQGNINLTSQLGKGSSISVELPRVRA